MHRATVRIEGVPALGTAISPEINSEIARSRMSVRENGDETIIEIHAEDSTALRASLSSALRYVAAASSAVKAIEKEE